MFSARISTKVKLKHRTLDLVAVESKANKWHHPGGKLRELGAENLTDRELLAILLAPGIKGKSAEDIAADILSRFGSFKGMANQPLEKFSKIKGLADVKIIRLAAVFEVARRIVNEVIRDREEN